MIRYATREVTKSSAKRCTSVAGNLPLTVLFFGSTQILPPVSHILRRAMAIVIAAMMLCCGAVPILAAAKETVPNLEIELCLWHALGKTTPAMDSGPSLLLDLTRMGDCWERVWGVHSHDRKPGLYRGFVLESQVATDRITLTLQMRVAGVSRVEVDVKRGTDGSLDGSYTLPISPAPVTGKVTGRVKPARPPLPAGVQPAQPGEHPRILIRAEEIPALKEKLGTPLGRVLFDNIGQEKGADAMGAGLKYVLTGDAKYAEQARAYAEKNMSGNVPDTYSERTAPGRLPEQVAIAFDLCYGAWPEDFKKKVVEYLATTGHRQLSGRGFNGNYNWFVASNWGAKVFQGAGFTGLALWGEKGPMPDPPKTSNAVDLAEYEFEVSEWKRLGGVNMEYQRIFEESRYVNYLFNREGIGTGGFRGECGGYGLKAMEVGVEYAAAYRKMFGRDLSPYNDITWAVPCMFFQHVFPSDPKARPTPLSINGHSDLWPNLVAYGYSLCPAEWRGPYLYGWNRSLGIPSVAEAAGVLAKETHWADDRRWFFVNYPFGPVSETSGVQPRSPDGIMPLTWQVPDFGFYGFRNGYKDENNFILLAYPKTRSVAGWQGPNAGTFHLFGLGQSWNESAGDREICVWEENRVLIPEMKLFDGGVGRVVQATTQPDGSGTLSVDLSDIYAVPPPKDVYSKYGNLRDPLAFPEGGIKALRALGVDYSGKSGAPCLFVLVDRIRGGKAKLWTWNLGSEAVVPKVQIEGNTFTIPGGRGNLHGTFVAPGTVKVTARINDGAGQSGHTCNLRSKTPIPPRKVPTLSAEGGDDFFLVATIQDPKTTVPAVKIEGAGLEAKIVVGGRVVRFDGTKVVFE